MDEKNYYEDFKVGRSNPKLQDIGEYLILVDILNQQGAGVEPTERVTQYMQQEYLREVYLGDIARLEDITEIMLKEHTTHREDERGELTVQRKILYRGTEDSISQDGIIQTDMYLIRRVSEDREVIIQLTSSLKRELNYVSYITERMSIKVEQKEIDDTRYYDISVNEVKGIIVSEDVRTLVTNEREMEVSEVYEDLMTIVESDEFREVMLQEEDEVNQVYKLGGK